MRRRHGHLYNSREVSTNAVLSVIMGAISLFSSIMMIYLTYRNGGEAELRYGGVVFVCLFISLFGLILAILSRREPEKKYLVSYIGMALNGLVLVLGFIIIYLGLGI